MITEQFYLKQMLLKCTLYICMLKDPFNEQIIVHNIVIYSSHFSPMSHIIASFKNSKHSTVLCMRPFSLICKCGVTNENNRSYLKNNRYFGENNRTNF